MIRIGCHGPAGLANGNDRNFIKEEPFCCSPLHDQGTIQVFTALKGKLYPSSLPEISQHLIDGFRYTFRTRCAYSFANHFTRTAPDHKHLPTSQGCLGLQIS
jgi:hypothetical protein